MKEIFVTQLGTRIAKKMIYTKIDGAAIPFPANLSVFEEKKELNFRRKVRGENGWMIKTERNIEGKIIFYLGDQKKNFRPIEWMKFHPAALLLDWGWFDEGVSKGRSSLIRAERCIRIIDESEIKKKLNDSLKELENLSDLELFSRSQEAYELWLIAGVEVDKLEEEKAEVLETEKNE